MSNASFVHQVSTTFPRNVLATSMSRYSDQETATNVYKKCFTSSKGGKHTGCYSSSKNCLGEHHPPQHSISSSGDAARVTKDKPRKPEKSASPESSGHTIATLGYNSTRNVCSTPKTAKQVSVPSKSLADIKDTWESLDTDHAPGAEDRCHDEARDATRTPSADHYYSPSTASQEQAATAQEPSSLERVQAALSPALLLESSASVDIPENCEPDTPAETKPKSKESPPQDAAARHRALLSENRRLKRRQMCRLCEQNAANITLLPCGHLIYCEACAQTVTQCGACHREILADVKTYMS